MRGHSLNACLTAAPPVRRDVGAFVEHRTTVVPDRAAVAALASCGVSVRPFLADARGGAVDFVIAGTPEDGTVEHVGGLLLEAGTGWLLLSNYVIDLDRGVLTGLVDLRGRVPLATLGSPASRGVALALTGEAAHLLDSRFGVTGLTGGTVVGHGNTILR